MAKHTSVRHALDYASRQNLSPNLKLKIFCIEVELSIRGARTLYRSEDTAWVYMEGEYMTMGWIGYGDFQRSKVGQAKYVVYSRFINNNKYRDDSDQNNMRMAKHQDIALKAAKAMLRNYTPVDVALALASKVQKPVREILSNADNAYAKAKLTVGIDRFDSTGGTGYEGGSGKRMVNMLEQLISSGHEFIDKEFHADVIALLIAKEGDARARGSTGVPMDFVRVYEQRSRQLVDHVRFSDICCRGAYQLGQKVLSSGVYGVHNTPEELQGKIAVMSMCADNQFVEGVGYKVDERTFYFYAEDVTT